MSDVLLFGGYPSRILRTYFPRTINANMGAVYVYTETSLRVSCMRICELRMRVPDVLDACVGASQELT